MKKDCTAQNLLHCAYYIVLTADQIYFTRKSQNCNAPKKTYICNYTFIFVEIHVNWKFKTACSFYTLYCL